MGVGGGLLHAEAGWPAACQPETFPVQTYGGNHGIDNYVRGGLITLGI